MIAAEQHITPEQAAERLLEQAAQLPLIPSAKPANLATSSEDYLTQLRERSTKRTEARRAAGDPMASIRPKTPDALIGFFAIAPEVAEAIRDMAYERRSHSYGI